jgi:PAS domain S-box-containing protein
MSEVSTQNELVPDQGGEGAFGVSQMPEMNFLEPLSREEEALALLQERNRFLERNKHAMINILEDIRESEERLRIQKEELDKFKLAVDSSFNHTVITDPDGKVLYANEAAERLTGFSFEEMRGKTPALWGKQMSHEFYEAFWYAIKHEKRPFLGEVTNCRKNGEKYLATVNVSPILNEQKKVKFFVGIERDITEERKHQKEIEQHAQELEEANERIRTEKERSEGILRFLQSIGEAVYATDADRKIIFINQTAAEYIGKHPEEIIGTHTSNHFIFESGGTDDLERQFPIKTVIDQHKTVIFPNHTFVVKGDTKLPVTGTASPIFDDAKKLLGVIVIFQDITEKYELERMKDRFLSVAAHQLRTPIGSMRWSMELLENGDLGKLPKAALETIKQLHENSDRMISLVNDLLNVSRIDQGRAKEEFQAVDLNELIQEALKTLNGEAQKKAMTMVYEAPKRAYPKLWIAKGHMFEALSNLIANAIRYNHEKGQVKVTLKKGKESMEIAVSDNGIGIPKEDQEKIFSKFFRAANAVRFFTDGSGLGLSVVKYYVEESGGTIRFESKENKGTTFFVSIPLRTEK